MIMKNKISILLLLFSLNLYAQEEAGIRFTEPENLDQALKLANEKNKLVFIDCYTVWCGPCKHLSKNIFPKKEVGDFYNENFINVKFDMEKGEGVEIRKKYGVQAFPTLLFLNSKGEVVHQQVGAGDEQYVLDMGKTALDPQNNLSGIRSRLESGEITADLINKYYRYDGMSKDEKWVDKYFEVVEDDKRISQESWKLIENVVNDIDSRHFQFLLQNEQAFKNAVEDSIAIDTKIMNVFAGQIQRARWIEDMDHPMAKKAISLTDMRIAQSKYYRSQDSANWNNYIDCTKKYFDTYGGGWHELNETAWFVYENFKKFNDLRSVEIASQWARKSMEMEKNLYNVDTYAALIYELGDVEQAAELQKEAVELVKKSNKTDYLKGYQERLETYQQALSKNSGSSN